MTRHPASTADQFERVWAELSAADRIVLLGHESDELTSADKVRLAALARAQSRPGAARSTRRTTSSAGRDAPGRR